MPGIFVVPKDRFNLKYGTNTAEVEFPGYWNFFLKGRSTTLVCTSEAANILSRVRHAGPRTHDCWPVPTSALPLLTRSSTRPGQVIDETLEGPAEEYLYTDDEYR